MATIRNKRTVPAEGRLASALHPAARLLSHRRLSAAFEAMGLHLTKTGFYSPIPSRRDYLGEATIAEFPRLEIDPAEIEARMGGLASEFADELALLREGKSGLYSPRNGAFEDVDADALYLMVRGGKPGRIVEIGSGFSSCCILDALSRNAAEGHPCVYRIWDPFPLDDLVQHLCEGTLVRAGAQGFSLESAAELGAGDILFIDSSHVAKYGSDVIHLLLRVVPSLRAGVIVHVHDVFLPHDYPMKFIEHDRNYWNEHYLVQAMLYKNSRYRVLWPGHQMHVDHTAWVSKVFASYDPAVSTPGSIWFRVEG